jgi:hypothetical protein
MEMWFEMLDQKLPDLTEPFSKGSLSLVPPSAAPRELSQP